MLLKINYYIFSESCECCLSPRNLFWNVSGRTETSCPESKASKKSGFALQNCLKTEVRKTQTQHLDKKIGMRNNLKTMSKVREDIFFCSLQTAFHMNTSIGGHYINAYKRIMLSLWVVVKYCF
ncbi:uncharacterized protein LOC143988185 [Lithobates pipiens]